MPSRASTPVPSDFLNDKAAEQYKNAENATRHFARIIVQKSGIAESIESGEEVHVLDFACGTGAVIQEVYDSVPKEKWGQLRVTGTDFSPAMLGYLRKRGEKEEWTGLDTKIVDGTDDITQFLPASTYTHIFLSFAITVMPAHTLQRLSSLLRPNGFIAITSWVTMPWYPLLVRSIRTMSTPQPHSPTADEIQNTFCRDWASGDYMGQQLQKAGFSQHGILVEKNKARVGSPDAFVASMQFVLGIVARTWWPEEGRAEKLQELNRTMEKAAADDVVEGGVVEMEFEGIVGWGWKSR